MIQRNLASEEPVTNNKEHKPIDEFINVKKREKRTKTTNKYATMKPDDVLQIEIEPYQVTFWIKNSIIPYTDHPLYNKSFNSMADESSEDMEFTHLPTTSIYGGIFLTTPSVNEAVERQEVKDIFNALHGGIVTTELIGRNNKDEKEILETQVQSTRGFEESIEEIIPHQQSHTYAKNKDSFEYKVTLLERKLKSNPYKAAKILSSTRGYVERFLNGNRFDMFTRDREQIVNKIKRSSDNTNMATEKPNLDYDFFFNLMLDKKKIKNYEHMDLT